jgi:hypothetical protein
MFSADFFSPAADGSHEHVSHTRAARLEDLPLSRLAPACLQTLTLRSKRVAPHRALWHICTSRLQAVCKRPYATRTAAPKRSVSAAITT